MLHNLVARFRSAAYNPHFRIGTKKGKGMNQLTLTPPDVPEINDRHAADLAGIRAALLLRSAPTVVRFGERAAAGLGTPALKAPQTGNLFFQQRRLF
jgi:hypothetical protein